MRILLLSAYHAASHQSWCQGLIQHFPNIHWQMLSLPPRHFAWRIRGNALSWLLQQKNVLDADYDMVLATSMVDLASLRGFVPGLARLPALVYFHENQFAYPASARQSGLLEAQLVNLYSAVAANKNVFNSRFNRDSFLRGAGALIKKLPDEKEGELLKMLDAKSTCLPVPISDLQHSGQFLRGAEENRVAIVWNHRWEYDKGPERLLEALRLLDESLPLQVHVVGQQFREIPPVFAKVKQLLAKRGWDGYWGFIEDKNTYRNLLVQSDIAVSTAIHDFQGLSVLEAVAQGCVPIVPDRLAYREIFPSEARYFSASSDDLQDETPATKELEAKALASRVTQEVQDVLLGRTNSVPDVSAWSWSHLRQHYSELFESVVAEGVSFAPFNKR